MERTQDPWRQRLLLGGAVAWSAWLFYHYFRLPAALDPYPLRALSWVPTPFHVDPFLGTWIWFLKDLLGAILVGVFFLALGKRVARWIGLGPDPGPLGALIRSVLGAFALGSGWTALGLNGLWEGTFLRLVLMGGVLWALLDLRGEWETGTRKGWDPGTRGFLALGGCFGVLALAMAATPDVFYDGLIYHLATLKSWMDRHGIVDLPANLYTYYPFGGEMVLFNGYLLGGSEGAKVFNALGLVLTGAVAGLWVGEEVGAWAGAATWAMVMTVPLFNACVWTTHVDVLLALCALLFLLSLWRFSQGRGRGWALAAGAFAGAALSVKYTAGLGFLLGMGLVWSLGSARRGDRGWVLAGLAAAFLFSPWPIKNLVFRADPLYPYPFLGMGGLPKAFLDRLMSDHQASWLGGPSLWDWLRRVITQDLDRTTAPLVLGFLPLLFFWRRSPAVARSLWILGWAWLLLGFGVSHQPRLSVPAFAVLLTAAGMGLGTLPSPGWRRWVAGLLWAFGILSLLSVGRLAARFYEVGPVWWGGEDREGYLSKNLQTRYYYPLTQEAAKRVPWDKRLWVVGDARTLYYEQPVVANSIFDPQVVDLLGSQDPDRMRRSLREMGVDGLVISGVEGARLFADRFPYTADGPAPGLWAAFRSRWLRPLYVEGKDAIFLLRDGPAP